MLKDIEQLPEFRIVTKHGRSLVINQSVDRFANPILTIDVYSVTMQRQATVKIGFGDIQLLRTALQEFADAMLETMCDY